MKARESMVEKVKNIAELLRGNDISGAMELIERELCDFFTKSCVMENSVNPRSTALCLHCKNFDEVNLVCKWIPLSVEERNL